LSPDQIIDPHYENDSLPVPENRLLKAFYGASKVINMNMWIRHLIFLAVVVLVVASAVLDVVKTAAGLDDSFLNGFSRLREKLAPRREIGA
jgi:hypothetical protein